jgi:CDP-paratose 2-epimerase
MRVLITGVCGFVGQTLAQVLPAHLAGLELMGLDNLIRPGSELNRRQVTGLGVRFFHADVRNQADLESLPAADWVIDAAANASVLAGLGTPAASRQLLDHNLSGTVNLLEYCKRHRAGFILLSTNRVYAIAPLAGLKMQAEAKAWRPVPTQPWPAGCSAAGIAEGFSTEPPVSLYGSTKLASEFLAREYGSSFAFPVWINRCGLLAGAGQFGRPDQGIFSYWIHAYAARKPLKYTGFDGQGFQVRDCLHPAELAPVLARQLKQPAPQLEPPLNFGGGNANSMSLAQLSDWCARRFGPHAVNSDPTPRPFDIPWMVMDCAAAARRWDWKPRRGLETILEDIARHAEQHPDWLEVSAG